MRKVLLFLVVSFIIMGTLGAHAIIPDSATVEIPTPESDYIQDTDVQSENFAESEPVVVEPVVDETTEQAEDELSVVDSEAPKEMVAESLQKGSGCPRGTVEPGEQTCRDGHQVYAYFVRRACKVSENSRKFL